MKVDRQATGRRVTACYCMPLACAA